MFSVPQTPLPRAKKNQSWRFVFSVQHLSRLPFPIRRSRPSSPLKVYLEISAQKVAMSQSICQSRRRALEKAHVTLEHRSGAASWWWMCSVKPEVSMPIPHVKTPGRWFTQVFSGRPSRWGLRSLCAVLIASWFSRISLVVMWQSYRMWQSPHKIAFCKRSALAVFLLLLLSLSHGFLLQWWISTDVIYFKKRRRDNCS